MIPIFLLLLTVGYLTSPAIGTDWPQWLGPNRNGVSDETGLATNWPRSGPRVLWRTPLGEGFSAISVVGNSAYTMFADGSTEYAICLDASTGKERWRVQTGSKFYDPEGGNGPRSTPSVDGNSVFVLSAEGHLFALNKETGKESWSHSFTKEYGSRVPGWGFSTSPLIEGDLLLVEVGGPSEKSLIAFDKTTGQIVWSSQSDRPSYAAPLSVTVEGTRQIIFFPATGLVSVSPEKGTLLWRHRWQTGPEVNAATPVFVPPNQIFISSGYGKGATLLTLRQDNGQFRVREAWRSKVMKNHFASSILHNGYLYGFDNAILKCIDAKTGEEQWRKRGFRKGSLIVAEDHLIILGEQGLLALAEATPEGYKEKTSARVLSGRCWTIPTLANGKLYLRNLKEAICLDITQKN